MTDSSTDALIPRRLLFRFELPCLWRSEIWSPTGCQLESKYRMLTLGTLEGAPEFADVRMAWNEKGLVFNVRVTGKRRQPWCRDSRPSDSDGLHLWIDTRDTQTIHRASRFCHRFVILPAGSGPKYAHPYVTLLSINRARENPRMIPGGMLQVRGERRVDGYLLEACVPSESLTGFDPSEHPRLGFTYHVLDSELGEQTLSCPTTLPMSEDPSLWGSLELIK